MADMMLRTFKCRSSAFMLLLWKMYLRPTLEYASQVWNDSYHALRLEHIEGLQKKIDEFREVPYENCLYVRAANAIYEKIVLRLEFYS